MTISSINLALAASSYGAYTQKLTQATKQKLEELGIYYDENTTESQAKSLIQKAQEVQKNEEAQNQSGSQGENQAAQNDLMQKAIKLAKEVGVEVDENADFDTLTAQIEDALEAKINSSQNNLAALKELQGLAQELANIQAQANGSSGYDSTNQALMESLEMLSEYNKNYLLR